MAKSSKAAGGGRQGAGQSSATAVAESVTPAAVPEVVETTATEIDSPEVSGDAVAAPFPEDEGDGLLWATLKLPLLETYEGIAPRHVDMILKPRQARIMRRLMLALHGKPFEIDEATGETKQHGRTIDSAGRVIQWLLNQIDAQEIKASLSGNPEDTESAEAS